MMGPFQEKNYGLRPGYSFTTVSGLLIKPCLAFEHCLLCVKLDVCIVRKVWGTDEGKTFFFSSLNGLTSDTFVSEPFWYLVV